jgi:DNA repair ATPase RecN
MAEQLTGLIQDLARQLREARSERDSLQQRLPALEEAGAIRTSVRQSLQNLPPATVSSEDVQSLRALLDSLAQTPKDLDLLTQVAARASDLSAMVNDYVQLQSTVDDLAGHVGLRPAQ